MLRYFLNRFFTSLIIVWGVLSITFLILHLASGDPTSLYLKPEIDEKTLENIRRQMGLNLPLWQQYILWIREFVTGNFGVSFVQQRPIRDILGEALLNTLQLTSVVFVLQLLLGVVLGIITAVNRHTKLDVSISSVLLFFYSMPGFWLALIAIMIFSLKLGWLPSSQMKSFLEIGGIWSQVLDRIKHLILPVTVLSVPFIAYTARFVRGSVSEILEQDYIRTALAYGISKRQILYKYTLKNALLPLATLLGLYLPFLLGGAVITEYIFAWPGMGRITVNAIFAHDFPVILASTFIAAITVIVGNLISDLMYVAVDPRIKIRTGHFSN
jgi:peptide/nickel transport system permease protein